MAQRHAPDTGERREKIQSPPCSNHQPDRSGVSKTEDRSSDSKRNSVDETERRGKKRINVTNRDRENEPAWNAHAETDRADGSREPDISRSFPQ